MGMAYVVTKMNALATNITFSHFDTSSTSAYLTLILICIPKITKTHNIDILTDIYEKSKQKKFFFYFFVFMFHFLGKAVKIQYMCP